MGEETVRLDKWLWAARMFKTRSLAADAVRGGHVQVGGQRVKPSRAVHPGDRLDVSRGQVRMSLVVRALSARRGPAADAARLYEETPESVAARERAAAERRLSPPAERAGPRPTKRDRRRFESGVHRMGD